jgi:hypothetical protein
LIQALGTRKIKDIKEIRIIVRNSTRIKSFTPQNTNEWKREYQKYKNSVF